MIDFRVSFRQKIDKFHFFRFVPSLSGKHRFEAGDTNLSQSLKCLETIGFHEKVGI